MFHMLGPDDRGEEDREGQRRQREPSVGEAHDHLVDPAAEIARNDAERRPDGAGKDHRGEADHHRDPGAKDQPREHVAAELVGAEEVFGAAAGLPEGRFEARRQAADLGIVRRQHVGEDRHEGDDDEDQTPGSAGSHRAEEEARRDGERGGRAMTSV